MRPFRESDAPDLAEWLDALAPAEDVYTPVSLVHARRMLPARRHPLWLVGLISAEPVALGREEPQIFGSRPGLRRTWVGVRPDLRRQGIGSRLWREIETHARAVGAQTFRGWSVATVPEGERFLLARGFSVSERELQSWVDPTSIDPGQMQRRLADATRRGFRVITLREALPGHATALRRLFLGAHRGTPATVAANTFRRVILQNPLLDFDSSAVVFHGDEPVALSWLKGDRGVGRYGVEFTGTAHAWRGQGLATLAKLVALNNAARAGIRWVGTANADDNAPMLAVNRNLGHQPLPDLAIYERSVER